MPWLSYERCASPSRVLTKQEPCSVSSRRAAGLSGCAPCHLCRHGHSTPIPPAFAPAALRALLASRGSAQGPSPPRAAWRPSSTAEPTASDRPGQRPAAMVRARRIRRSLLRQVVRMRVVLDAGGSRPSHHKGWFTDTTPDLAMKLPRYVSMPAPQGAAGGVLICRWRVGLAGVRERAVETFVRGCRAGHGSFRSGSAQGVLISL
jgi:hypothetical protein